jgi:hypothetical protein
MVMHKISQLLLSLVQALVVSLVSTMPPREIIQIGAKNLQNYLDYHHCLHSKARKFTCKQDRKIKWFMQDLLYNLPSFSKNLDVM